jgi:hypothetical protein
MLMQVASQPAWKSVAIDGNKMCLAIGDLVETRWGHGGDMMPCASNIHGDD